jgi:crotonobetainyl-CoA:carnitine CoA-transferase CaiB-like acyl-CoA transferase
MQAKGRSDVTDVSTATAPLSGIRVLELSNGLPGIQAGQFLADFGADVVQVEPVGGSPLRSQPAWPFWARGKRSVALDLHRADDRDAARRMALAADVVIETFRPGAAARLGLGYDDLAADNPGLVYASITGFGSTGPLADLPGYEGIVAAKLGVLAQLSDMTERPGPSFPSAPYCSYPAAQLALQGIMAALYVREATGVGQRVETTLAQALTVHDTLNWFSRVVASRFSGGFSQAPLATKGVPAGGLSFRLLIALTADGKWLQFSQTVDRLFRSMMRMFGLDWMFDDPKWQRAPDFDDVAQRVEFWERLLTVVRSKTLAEWRALFDEDHDVWAEMFSRDDEVLDHPQMRWNEMVVTVEDPERGPVVQPAPVVRLFGSAPSLAPAPALGSHEAGAVATEWAAAGPPGDMPAHGDSAGEDAAGDAPLRGVTVIELGTYYAAPYGATLLADLGARVIKLEQLDGDPHRNMLPFPEVAGMKVLQGKESVAVDIATEEGRQIAYDLVRRSDVVLQSFRAGVAERLGVDAASLQAVNPDLVYLSAPGYGTDGPCGGRPAFAPTIGAAAGLAWRNAGATIPARADLGLDEIKPTAMRLALAVMGVGNSDGFAGVTCGTALMLGLLARRRGNGAHRMLTTMLSSNVHALSEGMVRYDGAPPRPVADPELYGLGPLYRLYETADGWVFLAAPGERDWALLAGALATAGGLDVAGDNRFSTPAGREEHGAALAALLAGAFAERPAGEWEALLRDAGVACVAVASGPVESNFLDDGSIGRTLGFVTEVENPMLDAVPRLAALIGFSRSSTDARGACLLGQHTDAVLAELGYDPERVAALRVAGVVGA